MGRADDSSRDAALQVVLAAAIAYVEDVKDDDYDFTVPHPVAATLPEPTARINLGTLRLARREDERRKSPDGLVNMGELGSNRVSTGDIDIDRLLGIGRFVGMRFA